MTIFTPIDVNRYREATGRVTKQPGITLLNRTCSVCGKRGTGMVKKPGTGSSRQNPSVWWCAEHVVCQE